jgi:hypothetical protein
MKSSSMASGPKIGTFMSLEGDVMADQMQPINEEDPLKAEVTAIIEDFGDDPRAAIRALLIEQDILEQRIGRLASALSFGYVRGRTGVIPEQSC